MKFTEGKILKPMISFTVPVLLAMCLQAAYGAVDLLVVGRFASPADVSAVSTGSQLMQTLTGLITGLAMGMTIILGQEIGRNRSGEAGKTLGAGMVMFAAVSVLLTAGVVLLGRFLAGILNAPPEAFDKTVSYIRICGGGAFFIVAFNLICSVFRGIGNSKLPLYSVAIACAANIIGDLVLVSVFHLGASGAALATVGAQALSMLISGFMIRKSGLPFMFQKNYIRRDLSRMKRIFRLGLPIALQDLLVGISFMVILSIVNSLGVTASAGVGVAEKVCAFIMLVPSAFSQAISAIVAQNYGAGKMERAWKSLKYGIAVSFSFGVVMFWISFFHGDLLSSIFAKDAEVIAAGHSYLKAYAIDCLLTAVFFCFSGFYNGIGRTRFNMIQSVTGAFLVRIPVSFFMSRIRPVSLFRVGLATPCSSFVQVILCLLYMRKIRKELK